MVCRRLGGWTSDELGPNIEFRNSLVCFCRVGNGHGLPKEQPEIRLIRQGKVHYVGISDAPAWWIAQANILAQLRGWSPFVGLQIEYSLIERSVERELLPMAKALNLGLTAWSPLAKGILSGKYHGHSSSGEGRLNNDTMRAYKDLMPEQQRADRIVAAVKAVSDQTGCGMAQVELARPRYRPVPVIPIIGARKLSQLQDNLASFDLALSAEQVKALEEASQIDLGFPYHLYARESVRAVAFGGMRDQITA